MWVRSGRHQSATILTRSERTHTPPQDGETMAVTRCVTRDGHAWSNRQAYRSSECHAITHRAKRRGAWQTLSHLHRVLRSVHSDRFARDRREAQSPLETSRSCLGRVRQWPSHRAPERAGTRRNAPERGGTRGRSPGVHTSPLAPTIWRNDGMPVMTGTVPQGIALSSEYPSLSE